MANLIPVQMQYQTRREIRARFMIAGSLVAIAAAAIAAAILLPSYVSLVDGAGAGIDSGAGLSDEVVRDDAAAMKHTDALLHAVSPILSASSSATSIITSVVSMRPKGIHIDQIIYAPGAQGSILLSGNADSDTAVSDYRAALMSDSRFTSVSVPVGALVGTDSGRFSMTILGSF